MIETLASTSISMKIILICIAFCCSFTNIQSRTDVWNDVDCNTEFHPPDCDFNKISVPTVDDFDRCAPARLSLDARNYFLGASGRRITYKDNKDAFDRIRLKPRLVHDVSRPSVRTMVRGMELDLPIGFSPTALQKLAHPDGEMATIKAIRNTRTVMILSCFASTLIEDVARANHLGKAILWMQLYVFIDRTITLEIVRRAERNGYQALVLTVDAPRDGTFNCNGRNGRNVTLPYDIDCVNFPNGLYGTQNRYVKGITACVIRWLKSITMLPIIAKGVLTGEGAVELIEAGISGILVSNHGGRQLDGVMATIDALPEVVDAVHSFNPDIEVYMDGGVRSGYDVYKAIARGAKMVFLGRPVIWGLAINGTAGVKEVLNLLKTGFNEAMVLAGFSNSSQIGRNTLIPPTPIIS